MSREEVRFIITARDEASKVLRGVGSNLRGLGEHFKWAAAIGRKAWHGLVTGAKIAGVAIAAALGAALVKGFKRLVAIEDAEASLRGLGHTAKGVRTIMNSALASVKGTAFGLDEAASVAAATVAAGVKPGKELEGTLRLVADAATIAKTDMGSMGAIFNKVAATNKVQGEVIQQLGERGIPIIQFLSKSLGISTDEVLELSRQGKISFADFREAMDEGLGGAALNSGKTTTGAFKNMMAALSRFGAVLLKDIFPLAKVVFGGIGNLLDDMAKKVGPFAKTFSKSFSEFLKSDGVKQFVTDVMGAFQRLWAALTSEEFKQFVGEIVTALRDLWNFAAPIIARVAAYLYEKFQEALPTVKAIILEFIETVRSVVAFIRRHWGTIGPIVRNVWNIVESIVGGALKVIANLIRAVMAAIRGDWSGAWGFVKAALKAAWNSMKGVVTNALSALKGILTGLGRKVLGWIGDLGGLLKDAGKALIQGLIDGIKAMLSQLWSTLSDVADKITNFIHFSHGPLYPVGQKLIAGLTAGVAASLDELRREMREVAAVATPQLSPSLAFAGTGMGAGAAAAGGRSLFIAAGAVQVQVSVDGSGLSEGQLTTAVKSGVEPALERLAREIRAL